MKVYISADIEGITGATHWNETDKNKSDYLEFQNRMTDEVVSACQGAFSAGAKEIWVKDAHDSGRNILAEKLPKNVKLIRGWSGHPFMMVQELDDSFDALIMIGYHARAGSGGNPLAHTMSSSKIDTMTINDQWTSEFYLHGLVAASLNVPLVFLSGDIDICKEVSEVNHHIATHATMLGVGNSTISMQPTESRKAIKEKVKKALSGNLINRLLSVPESFQVKVRYMKQVDAYRASHYPSAKLIDSKTVLFQCTDIMDVMTFVLFAV
ncbi:MAG: M55 family metallopeptidase [Candidatus Marinimicrobia bacterium]|nr:M55 family metallopeptidase [Candidatus Neomarinimicrobiota bacterium]MBL7014638.1 M55 family metallopeptidase [Candidatus Neomarinimicrobiota bacterium]